MVGIINKTSEEIHCSGSLISDRFVLTAAHCVDGIANEDLQLIFGANDLSDICIECRIIGKLMIFKIFKCEIQMRPLYWISVNGTHNFIYCRKAKPSKQIFSFLQI